jgi:hypothetical protein
METFLKKDYEEKSLSRCYIKDSISLTDKELFGTDCGIKSSEFHRYVTLSR